jgi:hypothetical protein
MAIEMMHSTFDKDFFCVQVAQACEEQIAGTATEKVTIWLALEVPESWGAKALPESSLPAAVKAQLDQWQRQIPGVRVQLIKQGARFAGEGIAFFVALADEASPQLYRFQLARYEDLLAIDLAAVAARHPDYAPQQFREPISWSAPMASAIVAAPSGGCRSTNAWPNMLERMCGKRPTPAVIALPPH